MSALFFVDCGYFYRVWRRLSVNNSASFAIVVSLFHQGEQYQEPESTADRWPIQYLTPHHTMVNGSREDLGPVNVGWSTTIRVIMVCLLVPGCYCQKETMHTARYIVDWQDTLIYQQLLKSKLRWQRTFTSSGILGSSLFTRLIRYPLLPSAADVMSSKQAFKSWDHYENILPMNNTTIRFEEKDGLGVLASGNTLW